MKISAELEGGPPGAGGAGRALPDRQVRRLAAAVGLLDVEIPLLPLLQRAETAQLRHRGVVKSGGFALQDRLHFAEELGVIGHGGPVEGAKR